MKEKSKHLRKTLNVYWALVACLIFLPLLYIGLLVYCIIDINNASAFVYYFGITLMSLYCVLTIIALIYVANTAYRIFRSVAHEMNLTYKSKWFIWWTKKRVESYEQLLQYWDQVNELKKQQDKGVEHYEALNLLYEEIDGLWKRKLTAKWFIK
ncbi:hypothetical protein [Mycoplasma seminis]|uniref:Uncharacterized protein n=1 Tax=Mycoplasma seminis TaxID=512749 RepID=A0ABY9HA86_9MOLU|nr:hypothetical protein [Mycoplasma seminis]WLP85495.1 hypothetical protein Q8852_04215 [Mycoplasma seminis]